MQSKDSTLAHPWEPELIMGWLNYDFHISSHRQVRPYLSWVKCEGSYPRSLHWLYLRMRIVVLDCIIYKLYKRECVKVSWLQRTHTVDLWFSNGFPLGHRLFIDLSVQKCPSNQSLKWQLRPRNMQFIESLVFFKKCIWNVDGLML